MTGNSRKIAYAGTTAALAVVCMALSVFLPLKTTPLLVATLCFIVAFSKSGLVYGLLSVAATLLCAFFMGGINTTFLFTAVLFAPYSLLCFFLNKLDYGKKRNLFVRGAAAALFVNAAAALLLFVLSRYILDYDLTALKDKIGGYWVLVLILTLFTVVIDYVFRIGTDYMLKRLK